MIIAAVTCVRDEADIIEEWIAHHLNIGIGRIHIFDNMSSDDTRARIDVIARQVPGVTVQAWPQGPSPQAFAYRRGLEIMRAENVAWCAFIDADEFIAPGPAADESFAAMLQRHREHAAIGLNWSVYGSSGLVQRPDGLTQEVFLRRAETDFSVNRHIKSIVRPSCTKGVHHMHGFDLDLPYYNAEGDEIIWRTQESGLAVVPFAYTENAPSLDGWHIKHYFCRWRDRWSEKVRVSKLRDVVPRSEIHWLHHDRNEVYDPSSLKWTADDRRLMQRFGLLDRLR